MRIKIIGENNCARATRHLLRLAGFAVTEYLPADALAGGPLAGYAITIDLAPAQHTPDDRLRSPDSAAGFGGHAHRSPAQGDEGGTHLGPDPSAHHHASASEGASRHPHLHRDASSPAFVEPAATLRGEARIHFDSVDSELEAAVLRHVTQLAAAPVIVDRPGGVVHSDRELRIVAPNTGDARLDEAAAVAIEFGVLRGLLDLTAPASQKRVRGLASGKGAAGEASEDTGNLKSAHKWKWWPFGIFLLAVFWGATSSFQGPFLGAARTPALHLAAALPPLTLLRFAAADPPQGQFPVGTAIDPCAAQAKSYASINQTANTQLVTGTASKKIYVCSIHVVAAAAMNVAVVEGTGTVCGTGSAGVSGFGGATAATGWNFAANGGIALGNGESSLGAEATAGDNLCIFNSGSSQVSGGISYVVQ